MSYFAKLNIDEVHVGMTIYFIPYEEILNLPFSDIASGTQFVVSGIDSAQIVITDGYHRIAIANSAEGIKYFQKAV